MQPEDRNFALSRELGAPKIYGHYSRKDESWDQIEIGFKAVVGFTISGRNALKLFDLHQAP